MAAHSLETRHRVLLVGPPGNGKTTLVEAIAAALSVPFGFGAGRRSDPELRRDTGRLVEARGHARGIGGLSAPI